MATPRKDPKDYLKVGAPTLYNDDLAEKICEVIATHSIGLMKMHEMYDFFPEPNTIYRWIRKYPEFYSQYLHARRQQAHVMAEYICEIDTNIPVYTDKEGVERIDSGMLGRAKLSYETKKWHASKMEPLIYGDQKYTDDLLSKNNALLEECKVLKQQLDEKNKKDY